MLLVSELMTYHFCQRKLFLEKVMNLKGPVSEAMVRGSIKHELYNKISTADYDIVSNIKQELELEEVLLLYRRRYFNILNSLISKNLKKIFFLKLNPNDFRTELWNLLLNESRLRASYVHEGLEKTKLFGEELWKSLYPMSFNEMQVTSESIGLKGSVDRVELRDSIYTPIEIKSGKPPAKGVWPDHKTQVIAYSLLLQEHFKQPIHSGYVNYIDSQLQRFVSIDDISRKKVLSTLKDIEKLLSENKLPRIIDDKKKCDACNLKEKCYAIKEGQVAS